MFCTKCGTQNSEGNAFCVNCGAPMQNDNPSVPTPQTTYNANAGTGPVTQTLMMNPATKSNYKLIGIIAVAAIAVVIVVIAVFMFSGKSSLIGTWSLDQSGTEITLTFTKDGKVVTAYGDTKETSTYKTKGDSLMVTSEDGTEMTAQFKIYRTGGKTALDLTINEETSTLYKK